MTLFDRLFEIKLTEVKLTTGLDLDKFKRSPLAAKPITSTMQPAKALRPNKDTAGYNFGKPLVLQKRV